MPETCNKPEANGRTWASALRIVLCGMLMGAADVIPGVSGGTVALVLGIYRRLVAAISHFDHLLLGHLTARRWREAARHIDLRFLIALAGGIVVGFLALGTVIALLLDSPATRPLTTAAFFGMIAASAVLVARLVRMSDLTSLVFYMALALIAAAFAWWLTKLEITDSANPSLPYLFLCGMIAICAMILPGISGAHILFILGTYTFVLGIVLGIVHGEVAGASLLALAVFAAGCACGLLMFSKVLRWLLDHYNGPTMAILCGFIVGALRKVWPFQERRIVELGEIEKELFDPRWPTQFGSHEMLVITVALAAFALVLVVDWLANTKQSPHSKGVS